MTELLTTRQVQESLLVDRTTIYRLVASGQLPAIRVGKQWRFARAAIESLLQHKAARVAAGAAAAAIDNDAALPFAAQVSSAGIQQLQDLFAELLGVMLVVTDMQGHPLTDPSHVCGYYRSLMGAHGLGRLCDVTWPQLAAALPLKPQFVISQLGPLCARAFIRVENGLAGMLVAGCVAPDMWPPSGERIDALAGQARMEPGQLAQRVHAVHVLLSADQTRVLDVIQRIADIISTLIAERLLLTRLRASNRQPAL